MSKLNDAQLVILSAASQNPEGLILPLPNSISDDASKSEQLLRRLLKQHMIVEQAATAGQSTWREAEDGQRLTLFITDAGRQAIGLETNEVDHPEVEARPSAKRKPTPPSSTKGAKPEELKSAKLKKGPKQSMLRKKSLNTTAPVPGTKQALLVKLLSRKTGATISEAVEATGWQAHSVRGAISGLLKRKLGLTVISDASGTRGRVYRIAH